MQSRRNYATALLAIWCTTKNARVHPRLQVRRVVCRHLCEQAFFRIMRRLQKSLRDAWAHEELRIAFPQWRQDLRQHRALFRSEHLCSIFTLLRSIETPPDAGHLPTCAPERHVLFHISRALHHWPCNGPVNIYFAIANILENAVIRG